MLAEIMLILQLFGRFTQLRVNHLAPSRHLCHLFKDHRIVDGLLCVLPPGERPVVLAQDAGNYSTISFPVFTS